MELLTGILASAIALGAIYAASSVSLALLWGSISMLNLAHGALIVIGGYGSVLVVNGLGMPWWLGLAGGMISGAVGGLLLYLTQVRWIFGKANFDLRIIILTMAFATIVVDLINNLIGPKILRQPFQISGRVELGDFSINAQTILVVLCCAAMVTILQLVVHRTNLGRLIRAVSQDITAARLNGVPVQQVILQVTVLAGLIAGVSGVLLTSSTTVYPGAGFDPLLKALIVCVLGGLGSIPGALVASFALAAMEITVQYLFGVKWGFPVSLLAVVLVLIYRPNGLFGRQEMVRN